MQGALLLFTAAAVFNSLLSILAAYKATKLNKELQDGYMHSWAHKNPQLPKLRRVQFVWLWAGTFAIAEASFVAMLLIMVVVAGSIGAILCTLVGLFFPVVLAVVHKTWRDDYLEGRIARFL